MQHFFFLFIKVLFSLQFKLFAWKKKKKRPGVYSWLPRKIVKFSIFSSEKMPTSWDLTLFPCKQSTPGLCQAWEQIGQPWHWRSEHGSYLSVVCSLEHCPIVSPPLCSLALSPRESQLCLELSWALGSYCMFSCLMFIPCSSQSRSEDRSLTSSRQHMITDLSQQHLVILPVTNALGNSLALLTLLPCFHHLGIKEHWWLLFSNYLLS